MEIITANTHTSFIIFVPKHFVLFDTIINEIV